MVIKSLKLHNFGVYAGDNEFVFEGDKPIVLIGGMNGRGKTTFLEAILLALYGPNSFAYTESEYKTYAQYLRSYVNRNAIDSLCWIELNFVLQMGDSLEKYRIVREWEGFSKRINESLIVYKDEEYSEFLTNNWSMFVENILPSALSNLFMFDGEKIAELAVDSSNDQLKKAIRSMLGISVLDVLKNDVIRNLKKANKAESNHDTNNTLTEIRQAKEQLTDELDSLRVQREDLQIKLDNEKSHLEGLMQMYSKQGGIAAEMRQETIQKRSDCTAELALLNNKLIEYVSGDLPLRMVDDLLKDIKDHAEIENEEIVLRKTIDRLEYYQKIFEKQSSSKAKGSAEFVEYIKQLSIEKDIEQIYCLSDHSLYQLSFLVDNQIENSIADVKTLMNRKNELHKLLDELDSYLNLDINSQELETVQGEIKDTETQVINDQVKLSELNNQISELETRLRNITIEFNRIIETYLADAEYHDGLSRTTAYSEMIINVIDKYTVELQKRKAELLGVTITSCYKKLASKKSLIDHIVMNPEELDYTFYSDDGKVVPNDSLSAGEQQIMIISILWALAICSKQKLPVIIDTPLSRLDSHHRRTIIKKYFPFASQQTIILSTDSEIDDKYYQMMKENIGDEYTLIYDDNTKSTSIQKGYQLGN